MATKRFLELEDHVGVRDDGSLEPLHHIGVVIPVETMVDGQILQLSEHQELKPDVAGGRTFSHDDPRVIGQLLETGLFHEVDKPTKRDLEKQASTTQDAVEAAKNTDPEERA